jgi:hypothetical protein
MNSRVGGGGGPQGGTPTRIGKLGEVVLILVVHLELGVIVELILVVEVGFHQGADGGAECFTPWGRVIKTMTPEGFKLLARSVTSARSVLSVNPLKLAKWHRDLFELPESLFQQQGCGPLFDQLGVAVAGIAKMSSVLGPELKISYRELAARCVGSWTLLVRSELNEPYPFLIRWDSRNSRWSLHAADNLEKVQLVADLEAGVAAAASWAEDLEKKARADEAELSETLGETKRAPGVEPP